MLLFNPRLTDYHIDRLRGSVLNMWYTLPLFGSSGLPYRHPRLLRYVVYMYMVFYVVDTGLGPYVICPAGLSVSCRRCLGSLLFGTHLPTYLYSYPPINFLLPKHPAYTTSTAALDITKLLGYLPPDLAASLSVL
ncbi:hypothetical protein F4861DRAFT_309397 [Xylaria intraflava]|nr:hypothetical protein F4861DRAFT_309397 [Xylaria intraflava]